jgi:hypothetical protein
VADSNPYKKLKLIGKPGVFSFVLRLIGAFFDVDVIKLDQIYQFRDFFKADLVDFVLTDVIMVASLLDDFFVIFVFF